LFPIFSILHYSLVDTTPIFRVYAIRYKSVKGGVGPILPLLDVSVFDRIPMDVIDVSAKLRFIGITAPRTVVVKTFVRDERL